MFDKVYFFYARHDFYTSLLIIISAVCFYSFIKFIIKKQDDWPNLKKRHHISFTRNLIIVASILMLFFTWKGEIKAFVFSISAITAGLIVVFKEVILSFFSYFIVSSNNLFKIGDILEIDDKIGRVMDRSLIYTRISLLGPNAGKELMIPNILFTTTRFLNLSSNSIQKKMITIHTDIKKIEKKQTFIDNFFKDLNLNYSIYTDFASKSEIKLQYTIDLKEIEEQSLDFNKIKNDLIYNFLIEFKLN